MEHPNKRQRVKKACDSCRRKKIRCEGDTSSGSPCDTCLTFGAECTWKNVAQRRGPRPKHVHALEARLASLEAALQQNPVLSTRPRSPLVSPAISLDSFHFGSTNTAIDSGDEEEIEPLITRMEKLEIEVAPYFEHLGQTSGHRLAEKVLKLREETQGQPNIVEMPPSTFSRFDPWELQDYIPFTLDRFDFPEPTLLQTLITAYMRYINVFFPMFHQPTFCAAVESSLHERDASFAHVLLLVCALGARHVEDPRVVLPGQPKRASGWRWYHQVQISRRDIMKSPRLYDIQSYCLAAMFCATTHHSLAWMLVGIGLRMLHDVGVHRKRIYSPVPNLQEELWKRCYWMFVYMEVSMASETGRPCSLHPDDFDLDLPMNCDDEDWNAPDAVQGFNQPLGKPSRLSYFIHAIKLRQIHLRAIRSVFPVTDVGPTPTLDVLADIDSALNFWVESIPSHLIWSLASQNATDDVYFQQSAHLHLSYNHIRIMIHRPFVAVLKPTTSSAASHAQCTHAARANSRILKSYMHKMEAKAFFLPQIMIVAHSAAVVLLLSLWGAHRLQVRVDVQQTLSDVENCIAALKTCQEMYKTSRHLYDNLRLLVSRSNADFPEANPQSKGKRRMDSESCARESRTPDSTHSTNDLISTSGALDPVSLQSAPVPFTEAPYTIPVVQPALYDERNTYLADSWSAPSLVVSGNERLFSSPETAPPHAHSSPADADFDALLNPLAFDSLEAHPLPDLYGLPQDDQFLSMWSGTGMSTSLGDWATADLHSPRAHVMDPFDSVLRWSGSGPHVHA